MVLTHILLTLHWVGSSLVGYLWTVFDFFGSKAAINEGMPGGGGFNIGLHLLVAF